eukprot:8993780-Pyramimonas_sp.AAC.1
MDGLEHQVALELFAGRAVVAVLPAPEADRPRHLSKRAVPTISGSTKGCSTRRAAGGRFLLQVLKEPRSLSQGGPEKVRGRVRSGSIGGSGGGQEGVRRGSGGDNKEGVRRGSGGDKEGVRRGSGGAQEGVRGSVTDPSYAPLLARLLDGGGALLDGGGALLERWAKRPPTAGDMKFFIVVGREAHLVPVHVRQLEALGQVRRIQGTAGIIGVLPVIRAQHGH